MLLRKKGNTILSLEKYFVQENYSLNGQSISERQALKVMAVNPVAHKMLKSARRNELFSKIIFSIGASGLVASIADGISGDELTIAPTLFSAAIKGGGIVWWKASVNKSKKSIDVFNIQQSRAHVVNKHLNFYFGLNKSGLGLTMQY